MKRLRAYLRLLRSKMLRDPLPPERVAAGETDLEFGAHSSDGAVDDVGLYVEIVRLVEDAAHRKVKRVVGN